MQVIKNLLFFGLVAFCGRASAANAIQDLIDQAVGNSQAEVTIPPGTYRVDKKLRIANVDSFTVNAAGATMVLTVRTQAFQLYKCTAVTVKGLTIDHDPLPFTQATITGHAADWSWVEARIHDGYPQDPDSSSKIEVYDGQTGRLIPDVWTVYGATVEKLSGTGIRVNGTGGFSGKVNVGDKIAVECHGLLPHAVLIEQSTGCVLENVTLHTSTTFGFFETRGHGNRYTGLQIVPGPPPLTDGEPRLRSTNADAFHSKYASLGPVVENCRIIAPGDDGIAINGDYDVIIEAAGDSVIIAAKSSLETASGDTIRSFSTDGVFNFQAMVTGIAPVTADTARLAAVLATLNLQNPSLFRDFYKLSLSSAVSAAPGSPVCSINRKGNGFVVRNNYIANKRARGILIKAENGLIEGNTIEWNHMGGIVLSPELYWMEAGFSRSVRIIDNTLKHCLVNPGMWGTGQAGAITVSATGNGAFAPAGGHREIEISGNRIDSCLGVNILATSITGLEITGNMLMNTHIESRSHGRGLDVNTGAAVMIVNCGDVTLGGNIVDGFGGTDLLDTSNVTGITGADTGVTEGQVTGFSLAPLQFSTGRVHLRADPFTRTIAVLNPGHAEIVLTVCDVTGRTLYQSGPVSRSNLRLGADYPRGIYAVSVSVNGKLRPAKLLTLF